MSPISSAFRSVYESLLDPHRSAMAVAVMIFPRKHSLFISKIIIFYLIKYEREKKHANG